MSVADMVLLTWGVPKSQLSSRNVAFFQLFLFWAWLNLWVQTCREGDLTVGWLLIGG